MTELEQFRDQEFMNLETFRKSGIGVKTPVWFVQEGNSLYVWTFANSGKVKRIRNNAKVNVAPCKRRGEVIGAWTTAQASVDGSSGAVKHVEGLLRQKIGFGFSIFWVVEKVIEWARKENRVTIKISLA